MLFLRRPMLLTSLGKYAALKWQGLLKSFHSSSGHSIGFSSYRSLSTSFPVLITFSYDLPLSHIHKSDPGCFQVNYLSFGHQIKSTLSYYCLKAVTIVRWLLVYSLGSAPQKSLPELSLSNWSPPEAWEWTIEIGRVSPSLITPSPNTYPWDGIGISTGASPTQGNLTGIKSKKNVRFLPICLCCVQPVKGSQMNTLNQVR